MITRIESGPLPSVPSLTLLLLLLLLLREAVLGSLTVDTQPIQPSN